MCNYVFKDGTSCRLSNDGDDGMCLLHAETVNRRKKESLDRIYAQNIDNIVKSLGGIIEGAIFPPNMIFTHLSHHFTDCTFTGPVMINSVPQQPTSVTFNNCKGSYELTTIGITSPAQSVKFINCRTISDIFMNQEIKEIIILNCSKIKNIILSDLTNCQSIDITKSIADNVSIKKTKGGLVNISDCTIMNLNIEGPDYPINLTSNTISHSCKLEPHGQKSEIGIYGNIFTDHLYFQIKNQFGKIIIDNGPHNRKNRIENLIIQGEQLIGSVLITGAKINNAEIKLTSLSGEMKFINIKSNSFKVSPKHLGTSSNFENLELTSCEIQSGLEIKNIMIKTLAFENNIISGPVSFRNCHFLTDASFNKSIFKKNVMMDCSSKSADPSEDSVHGMVSFDEAIFEKDADFGNRTFSGKLSFNKTIFYEAPNFSGTTLSQHTTMETAIFRDVEVGQVKPYASERYRTLKSKMEELRDRRSQGKFFRCEQISHLLLGRKSGTEKWLSFLYGATSGYGMNVGRPLKLILATFIVFWYIYSILSIFDGHVFLSCFSNGFLEAMKQIFVPFSALRETKQYGIIWSVASIAHNLITYSLLAMFLISLRWRFKKD